MKETKLIVKFKAGEANHVGLEIICNFNGNPAEMAACRAYEKVVKEFTDHLSGKELKAPIEG